MPSVKTQTGLAPVIIILGLTILSAVAAGGYYLLSGQSKTPSAIALPAQPPPMPSAAQGISIKEVKEIHEESLLNMEGVEKVGIGEKDEKPCIVVFTFQETDELQNLEKNGLNGYEVKIENAAPTP